MKFIINLLCFMLFLSCTENKEPTVISILDDQTEEHISQFNPSDIFTRFELDKNLWEGYIYRYQSISGSDYNPITEVKLEAENELFGNNLDREEQLTVFKSTIENSQKPSKEEHKFSSIFLPLITEINYLQEQYPNAPKTIVLFSDLKDHNDWVSWYDNKTRNNEKTKQKYLAHLPKISKRNQIELRVIYTPSPEENKQFRKIISLYESLCKQMHIRFSVGASL